MQYPQRRDYRIPRELKALAEEAKKYGSAEEFEATLGIPKEHTVWIKVFGSSVEGKPRPRDIDIFIAVRDGAMKFTKDDELYNPITKEVGKIHYFIMPESQAMELLDAMLYTGRKDLSRAYKGKTVDIDSLQEFYRRATGEKHWRK